MSSVNLLPPEIRARQSAKRHGRLWAVVLLGAAGLAAIPVVVNMAKETQAASLQRRQEAVENERDELRKQRITTVARVETLRRQIARADALRTKRSWSGLLGLIGGCMPREVWLTSFATDPTQPSAGRGRAANAAPEGQHETKIRLEAPTHIVMTGYALDHNDLYEFMSRLKQAGVFDHVELARSGREPVLGGQAVRFNLECSW